MAAYTLFGQSPVSAGAVADNAAYAFGVEFSVDTPLPLSAIWWYSPPTAQELPETIALFAVSGQSLLHSESASWSGAAGSGWVRAAFTSPPALAQATAYKAVILKSGGGNNWYAATASWWTSGPGASGITSGPLSAPSSAASAEGQDNFIVSAVLAYPASGGTGTNYWLDPEVQTPVTAAALLTAII